MSFNTQYTNSYIYRFSDERTALLNNTYFNDIKTYPPDINNPDNPGSTADPVDHTYLQTATFKNTSQQYDKYFMIVNRRCSPYFASGDNGGRRFIKVKLDASAGDFADFINWKIVNIENNSVVVTFDKQTSSYLDLGWFMPGEGRLYKIVPVMVEGGELAVNEEFGSIAFTCRDSVISINKNITITGNSATINFTDSATIVMNGGTFQSSNFTDSPGPQKNIFQGNNGHNWNGLLFSGTNVLIYDSKFQNISSPVTNHAVKMIDCPLGDIRNNQFILDSDTAGAVSSVYTGSDIEYSGLYFNYNAITMNDSRANAVQVQAFSGMTFPVYIESNTMSSDGYATGVMLSTVTGGAVNYNTITGFSTGMNFMYSTIDLYSNTITNTTAESEGFLASSGSTLNMAGSGIFLLAGSNSIINTSGYSKNLHVAGALFNINNGYNTFDVVSSFPVQTWHLIGYFPSFTVYSTDAYYNCFKYSGTIIQDPNLPNNSVTEGEYGSLITFNFIPYSCQPRNPEGESIVNLGNGIYDTIPTVSGGSGGGLSNKKEKTFVISPEKILYDSICVQMRFRNYNSVKNICYNLINTFPDSLESIASLTKLFLAVAKTDTSVQSFTALKTYFENLILNHADNLALVKNCNYLVQKCKVRLREYQSALNGFQAIINQNPYSYEGLLARWDYMSTSLLIHGQGGSYRGDNVDGDDDKSPFTKEQRKMIKEAVINANEISRSHDEVKVKALEEKIKTGNATAERELKTLKVLKEVNKSYSPQNVMEHIKIVNNDIQKVFGNTVVNNSKIGNSLPTVFSLSQNFPNPFNPITTIKYALPKDVKVVIKVYDILGREVKTVVNELQKAGYYDVKFDGTNLASGIYFYRIEAGDFVQAKKMVLVK